MKKLLIWLWLLAFGCQYLLAQGGFLQQLADNYADEYLTTTSKHAAIFSGNRHQMLTISLNNHQYFKEEGFVIGRLSYLGVVYPKIKLRWDLYKDELVILSPSNYHIVLRNENVDFAEIYDYHIFYLSPDSLLGCPPAGNYILLHSGDCILLEKKIHTLSKDQNVQHNKKHTYHFNLVTRFYLKKDGAYYKITGKRTLLKSLGSRRQELRRFIRHNNLQLNQDVEKMVLEVVKEHERLNQL